MNDPSGKNVRKIVDVLFPALSLFGIDLIPYGQPYINTLNERK